MYSSVTHYFSIVLVNTQEMVALSQLNMTEKELTETLKHKTILE